MDPLFVGALLEWRNKTPSPGLLFPSHIAGRTHDPGSIQQNYLKPVARKLGLAELCWHTFPNSYRIWLEEDGTPARVQQRLMRRAPASTPINDHAATSLKPKRKPNGKIVRQPVPAVEPHVGISADA
jgi:hypothetical protein